MPPSSRYHHELSASTGRSSKNNSLRAMLHAISSTTWKWTPRAGRRNEDRMKSMPVLKGMGSASHIMTPTCNQAENRVTTESSLTPTANKSTIYSQTSLNIFQSVLSSSTWSAAEFQPSYLSHLNSWEHLFIVYLDSSQTHLQLLLHFVSRIILENLNADHFSSFQWTPFKVFWVLALAWLPVYLMPSIHKS